MIIDMILFIQCLEEKEKQVYEVMKEAGNQYIERLQEMEKKLTSIEATVAYPYYVLLQQQYCIEYCTILLQQLYSLLQTRVQQSLVVVEEKKIDPEIQARLDAERAKEEATMDAATLAKIREKRAAKEAKKNKKAGNKTKKLNIGNGLQTLLDVIISTYSSL